MMVTGIAFSSRFLKVRPAVGDALRLVVILGVGTA